MISTKSSLKEDDVSPESLVAPYEDINTKLKRISQERFPDSIFELCEKCHWTSVYFNLKGLVKKCPLCGEEATAILPMSIDETCSIEYNMTSDIIRSYQFPLYSAESLVSFVPISYASATS
jgi:hypothetical protein